MKHFVSDGRGGREVWLDGWLLEWVIECDDVTATAVVVPQPSRYDGTGIVTACIQGDCLVVRSIDQIGWGGSKV